ncbi:MAG: aminotransferase class III-fold pyridoxal phosphate-dependent enzyme, partial [Deltaproteobacteria bacterium]|nr:aminotransferase class III-fold pyridoxal phosphate-dependent enzyme [Deltaproteobacteria bacterium]
MKTSQEWIDLGKKVLFGNYSRIPLVPVRGEGCRVWDADGRCYLDFVAGIAVNALGHAYPRVVDAIEKQARSMIHCSNLYNIPPQIELAELLVAHTFADQVFFCNSGAEANEAAIKLARKYSHDTYGKERSGIVTALSSFHGRTMAT